MMMMMVVTMAVTMMVMPVIVMPPMVICGLWGVTAMLMCVLMVLHDAETTWNADPSQLGAAGVLEAD